MPGKRVNVFYHELKPIFIVLKFAGIIPYQISSQGELEFKILSLEVAYAILLQSAIIGITSLFLWVLVLEVQKQTFVAGMFYITAMLFLLPNVIILPLHWLEMNDQIRFINMWMTFQEEFYFITGESLVISLRLRAILAMAIAVAFFICGTLVSIWRGCINNECSLVSIAIRIYISVVIILVPALWEISCYALTQSTRKVIAHIKQSSRPSRFTALWFRLNTMAKELGISQGWTAGLITLIFFFLQVVLSYAVVTDFKTARSIYAGCLSAAIGLIIFTICNSGEATNLEMREKIIEQLYDTEHRIHISNRQAITEIHKFIAIIHRNAVRVTFSGFAVVNRSLNVAFLSALVTYIIVLAQFGMNSAPGANNTTCISLPNETSNTTA